VHALDVRLLDRQFLRQRLDDSGSAQLWTSGSGGDRTTSGGRLRITPPCEKGRGAGPLAAHTGSVLPGWRLPSGGSQLARARANRLRFRRPGPGPCRTGIRPRRPAR
jgi:hypothetical protein